MTSGVDRGPEPRVEHVERIERVTGPAYRATTVGLLLLVTMFAFEAVAVSLAMPRVVHALDGETLYPIAVVGLLTAAIPGMTLGGIWGDARGASAPITVGSLLFAAGLLVSALSTTMPVFVAGRLLQGLGSGLALTSMYVAVADSYPAHLRTRVFSLFATAWVLPSIIGPFVAGALVDLWGWRSVFWTVALFTLASVVTVRLSMRRHAVRRTRRLVWGSRPVYALVVAVGVVALHLGGQGSVGLGAVLVPVGLVVTFAAVRVLLPRGSMRAAPGLPAVVAARALFGAAFACLETFLPLVLQDETGLSPTATGLVMMVTALGWTAGSAYTGTRGNDFASRARIQTLGASALLAGALMICALVPFATHPFVAVGIATTGFLVAGTGMGLVMPLLSALALDLAPEGRQGASGAAIQISDALGQSIAAGVVGAVFARWFLVDQHDSYLSGFGLAVLLAALALHVVRRTGSARSRVAPA